MNNLQEGKEFYSKSAANASISFESLQAHEEFTRKSVYEYRCCKCQVKRKTRRRAVARKGVCNPCIKQRIIDEGDKRQMSMFD